MPRLLREILSSSKDAKPGQGAFIDEVALGDRQNTLDVSTV